MSYCKMLNKIIANTNLTQKEIRERCKRDYNINISSGYLSRLMNNKISSPSDEISRAIAKVCNADERLLVIEGYIDKAPKEIIEFFKKLNKLSIYEVSGVLENVINKNEVEMMKEEAEKETISNGIINILDMQDTLLKINNEKMSVDIGDNIIFNVNNLEGIVITDNAMKPLIDINDKVIVLVKKRYDNGDIVLIRKKGSDKILIRQIYNYGSEYIFTALNKEYKQFTIKNSDIEILGKVSKLIKNL